MHRSTNDKFQDTIFGNGFPFINKLITAYLIRLRNFLPVKIRTYSCNAPFIKHKISIKGSDICCESSLGRNSSNTEPNIKWMRMKTTGYRNALRRLWQPRFAVSTFSGNTPKVWIIRAFRRIICFTLKFQANACRSWHITVLCISFYGR